MPRAASAPSTVVPTPAGIRDDDPLAPFIAEVAGEAASVRDVGERLAASAAELKAEIGSARLVDQKAADDLVRKLAASADATAKATARAEVRDGIRRQASWLAGVGVALVLLSLAAGFAWGRATAPACPAGGVREQAGRLACSFWLTPPPASGEVGRR